MEVTFLNGARILCYTNYFYTMILTFLKKFMKSNLIFM